MACAAVPPGLLAYSAMAESIPAEKKPEQPDVYRRYSLFDRDSGEVFGEVVAMQAGGKGARARNARLMRAFQRYCEANNISLTMWTLGTPDTTPERLSQWATLLGEMLTGNGHMWTMVLEPGTAGGRWHIHALVTGRLEWDVVCPWWETITGIKGAHVQVTRVYSDGVGGYLAKYLSKNHEGGAGYRCFRSSRHLRRTVATFLDPPGNPIAFFPKARTETVRTFWQDGLDAMRVEDAEDV